MLRYGTLISRWFAGAVVFAWVAIAPASAAAVPWFIEPTANPTGALQSFFNGVSCATPFSCSAVGQYSTEVASYVTLAERRDGSTWNLQSTSNPSGSPITTLEGVSCVTPRTCTAVGHSSTSLGPAATLAERWDGADWQIQSTPNPASPMGSSDLLGVSCPTRQLCTAVGDYISDPNAPVFSSLAERWNGVRWEVQATPNPSGVNFSLLSGVSCATRDACTAVGASLAEGWNGTSWQIQPLPSPAGAAFISLAGVSCASPAACTAVGTYTTGVATLTLAERWNGTSWQIQPTPNPAGAAIATLTGVSCATLSTCEAVGTYSTSTASFTLIERWDGANWAIQPSPNAPGGSPTTLSAVSCTRRRGCTAVGAYSTSAGTFTLAERDSG
jgi:hypothetical protein